jgi:hypothetical protein
MDQPKNSAPKAIVAVACLLAVLLLQLIFSIRTESQTWDEGDHIFAGYLSWTNADFGLNPEHPPLAKLVATLPLLPLTLDVPQLQDRNFKIEAFLDGRDFLSRNGGGRILFRTRLAAAIFPVLLALLVFFAAREMFGEGAAFLALLIFVFEPNLLAHGALVTTDTALTCCFFATVYAFYRYARFPSLRRIAITGIAAGLTIAAKHTGLLIFPTLILLALCELLRRHGIGVTRRIARFSGALLAITLIAGGVLWACYGFRYKARPAGLELNPPLAREIERLQPREASTLATLERWRALPESYLYGLADVIHIADNSSSYVLGEVYPHGVWFYFPVAFAVKSTLGFLALVALSFAAIVTFRLTHWREIIFLAVPALFYLLVAMSSGLNIGVRHILPLYAFFTVLAAGAAIAFWRVHPRGWGYVIGVLLLAHAVSSARSFPVYMAYANELWGGPADTYKYLTDSNTDWGQQLLAVKQYLDVRGTKSCWFAYFAQTAAEPRDYGIPCRTLPVVSSLWLGEVEAVPPVIDGPVLISAGSLSGYETGPGAVNPYAQFQKLRPTAVIQHGVFVYDGRFHIALASAITHAALAYKLLASGDLDRALKEARAAVAADPDSVRAQIALGDVLTALRKPEEARLAYEMALNQARTVEPDFQKHWIPSLEKKLGL